MRDNNSTPDRQESREVRKFWDKDMNCEASGTAIKPIKYLLHALPPSLL